MKPGLIYHRQSVLLLLLFALSYISVTRVLAQEITLPQPEAISSQQGLPQAFVPAIVQDRQGFIWMATRDGLCRYDGNKFKVFQPTADERPGISSSSLSNLELDQQGRVWIFSDQNDIDIIDPVRETFTNLSRQSFFTKNFKRDIIDANYLDQQGRIWLSFLSDKVVCIDPATHRLQQYKRKPIPGYFPTFSTFQQDRQGTMWMSNKTGLYRLDQRTGLFTTFPLPDNDVRGLHLRHNGDLLVVSKNSVMMLTPQTGRVQSLALPAHIDPQYDSEWHHTNVVSDSQGNDYFNYYNILFRFNEAKGVTVLTQLAKSIAFRSLFIDRSDVLWGGTNKVGVLKYNLKAVAFQAIPYKSVFYRDLLTLGLGIPATQLPLMPKEALSYNFRYTIDPAGKLWFNLGNNQIYQIDLPTKKIIQVPFPLPLPLRYAWTDPVIPMATDPAGKVWAVTDSLAMWYEGAQWNLLHFPFRSNKPQVLGQSQMATLTNAIEGQILQVVVDSEALWLATNTQGLYRLDRTNGQIRQYSHKPGNPISLSSNQLFCLFDDPLDKDILWVGTFGSGLCRFNKRTGTCRRFTIQNGLPNNVIYAAIPDHQGYLWIATNQGICRMDRRSGQFQTQTYTHEDGLLEDEFNRFHSLHLSNDRILLGGMGGITSFYPHLLRDDTYQPPIQITDVQINNRSLMPGALTDSLPVQAINRLELPYNQNFITVSFAGLQFNRQGKVHYRYQLVGLNKEWIETSRPTIDYTDLRWGRYSLRLNASNMSGVWSKHIRVLELVILPPWWATWWAILLYVIIVLGVGYALVHSYLNQQEAKQLKLIDAMKARFFTNITHDFRTPLTLILAPVERLKQRSQNADDQHQLELINQNANQLLGLINQLMELSKAEANALRVNESQGDLVAFLAQLTQSFESQAAVKGIQIAFRPENVTTFFWFDTDKLERIVYNLVANALKFTPMGGKISVNLTVTTNRDVTDSYEGKYEQRSWVCLEISDNGIGISDEKLPYIFDRFYQVENFNKARASLYNSAEPSGDVAPDQPKYTDQRQPEGTGIGLALVKELVEVQHGTIQVISKVSIGTTFTVMLPYRPSDTLPIVDDQHLTLQPIIDPEIIADEQLSSEEPVVLVVEDNVALGDFIVDSLPASYQVHRAMNGAEGWEKALDIVPDLVISDVLMPIMDGYTLCHKLKSDQRTSHIPVILLTAKASVESRLEGLSLGADDYISKPFNVQELQLRIRNLLEQRRQLRTWVLASMSNPGPVLSAPAPTDPLLEKLFQLIEEHLDDATFGVEELILESGMSRMNLHRKLKALVDISTGEFIRNYRLKRAAQMLQQGRTVSETAYLVGFEDPSYFARSFRKVYNMTPSAFSRQS